MNIRLNSRELSDLSEQSEPKKATLLSRLLRLIVNILSSPKGFQGGWEGGARGL
jgi:hypothetical protein